MICKCRLYFLSHNCEEINRLPLHLRPFPVNPCLHEQLYEPLVLLQNASDLHLCSSETHSLTSERIHYKKKIKTKLSYQKKYIYMYRSTNNQQKLGGPPLLTVLNMVKVVFVLSESSILKNPPHLLNILNSNAHPRSLFHSQ